MIRASLHSLVVGVLLVAVLVVVVAVVDTLTNRMGIFICGHWHYIFLYALVACRCLQPNIFGATQIRFSLLFVLYSLLVVVVVIVVQIRICDKQLTVLFSARQLACVRRVEGRHLAGLRLTQLTTVCFAAQPALSLGLSLSVCFSLPICHL